jgi:hypothetical protein
VVSLSFDDRAYEVTGTTQPGHILDGIRYWQAQVDQKNPCSIVVKTWAHERSANSIDEATRIVFNFTFGDLQTEVWTDYLRNIGNHWKTQKNVTVTGPN